MDGTLPELFFRLLYWAFLAFAVPVAGACLLPLLAVVLFFLCLAALLFIACQIGQDLAAWRRARRNSR
ncbi:MAG: hypothetical protein AB1405_02000 [Bdellovibrionota bacterium]